MDGASQPTSRDILTPQPTQIVSPTPPDSNASVRVTEADCTDCTILSEHDPSQAAPSLHGSGGDVAFTEKESPVISNVQSPLLKNYISIKVANISTHAMIDSAADISCARPEVLPKYHLQFQVQKLPH